MTINLIKIPKDEFKEISTTELLRGGAFLTESTGEILISTNRLDLTGGDLILIQIIPGSGYFSTRVIKKSESIKAKRICIKDVVIHYQDY